MSKYTTEVRFICETLAGYDMSKGYGKVSEIVENSWEKVFDFDFPIFDPAYRSILCQKILKHYYTREIGFETVGLWKLKLETKMQEIMPYYNKLYLSETYNFNPLYDVDYTKTHEGSDSGDSNENNKHTGSIDDNATHEGTITDENQHTGTIEDSGTHGGTVGDSGTHGGTVEDAGTHGGTVGDSGTHGGTVTDVGTHGGTIGDAYEKDGTVGDTKHDENDKTTWNAFSDTPQGALTNVDNETYLTDARKITENFEDDETNDRVYEEEGSNTKTFNETNGNTRTYNETNGNTRTYDETNENTRTYDETNENTRTYNEITGNEREYNEEINNVRTFDEENKNKREFNENNKIDREFNNTNQYVEHVIGKTPGRSYAKMIMEYRDTLLNIDMQVIDELSKLFMLVW